MSGQSFNAVDWRTTILFVGGTALLLALLFAATLPIAFKSQRTPNRERSSPCPLAVILTPSVLLACVLMIFARFSTEASKLTITGRVPAYSCLALAAIIFNLPLVIYYCGRAAKAVPSSLLETAALDGASRLQQFWHIILPLGGLRLSAGFFATVAQSLAGWIILGRLRMSLAAKASIPIFADYLLLALLIVGSILALFFEAFARRAASPPD